jgi:MFS family permease
MDPAGVAMRPFLAALGASLCAGAALMVTLVDVELVAQTLLDRDSGGATLLLTPFLVALPAGALGGGFAVRALGERITAMLGLVVATAAYVLIGLRLPDLGLPLVLAGLGLGLVIAPLSSVVLRVSPATQHGIASAGVVVVRMIGMLLGVAALTAWGLHRFQQFTADLPTPLPFGMTETEYKTKLAAYQSALDVALRTEYREIFLITAGVCAVGMLLALLLPGRDRATVASPVTL